MEWMDVWINGYKQAEKTFKDDAEKVNTSKMKKHGDQKSKNT